MTSVRVGSDTGAAGRKVAKCDLNEPKWCKRPLYNPKEARLRKRFHAVSVKSTKLQVVFSLGSYTKAEMSKFSHGMRTPLEC